MDLAAFGIRQPYRPAERAVEEGHAMEGLCAAASRGQAGFAAPTPAVLGHFASTGPQSNSYLESRDPGLAPCMSLASSLHGQSVTDAYVEKPCRWLLNPTKPKAAKRTYIRASLFDCRTKRMDELTDRRMDRQARANCNYML